MGLCKPEPVNAVSNFNNQLIDVYPNPANDKINVKMNYKGSTRLYSISGNAVSEIIQVDNEGSINVEGLISGYYILRVVNSDKQVTHIPVIVNR